MWKKKIKHADLGPCKKSRVSCTLSVMGLGLKEHKPKVYFYYTYTGNANLGKYDSKMQFVFYKLVGSQYNTTSFYG